MRTIVTLLVFLFALSAFSQEINKKIKDEKSDKEILIGVCNRQGLMEGEFGKSFNKEYKKYEPHAGVVNKLEDKLKYHFITMVLGTWCHDSKEQVPRFFHILDSVNYPAGNLTIISVDRNKKAGDKDVDDLNIKRVPTFIVYRRGHEIGRIVETPDETLEEDLLQIISK